MWWSAGNERTGFPLPCIDLNAASMSLIAWRRSQISLRSGEGQKLERGNRWKVTLSPASIRPKTCIQRQIVTLNCGISDILMTLRKPKDLYVQCCSQRPTPISAEFHFPRTSWSPMVCWTRVEGTFRLPATPKRRYHLWSFEISMSIQKFNDGKG
jgi:hypothetical protein